ncbi:MAG TPA: hypothetical protein VFA29_01330 [Candidatus Baltobacteraceae bacterium]|nr:hypothetical protein [Candidatus Baltobacteraceae bacterium]
MMRLLCVLFSTALLTACGGGAGSGPAGGNAPNPPPPPKKLIKASVGFSVTVPRYNPASRRAFSISTNTQSVVIQPLSQSQPYVPSGTPAIINIAPGAPGCTNGQNGITCSATMAVAPGLFNFSVQSFAGQNGTGAVLAQNTLTSFVVVAGAANSITVTLNGVIGLVSAPYALAGTLTAAEPLGFLVQDATGAVIVGAGTYDNGPLAIADSAGLVTLTPGSFTGPLQSSTAQAQCTAAGSGTLQFSDNSGSLAAVPYTCTDTTISLTPGGLDFGALAANPTDPTYDQVVTVADSNNNVVAQTPAIACTPGTGNTTGGVALALTGTQSATYAIRPTDVGTCTFNVQDQLSDGSTPSSQTIQIEVHQASFTINARVRR